MSNLSDLLPAGASAKQLTFTDSGSGIASKKPVILNSDGTVTSISSSTTSAAVADVQAVWASTTQYNYNAICYAATEDRFVAISSNNATSSYPQYSIGTMSSGSITWGTPVIITSNAVDWLDIIYHSNTGRLVLIYTISSQAQCIIGTFGSSPYTTISWAGQTQAYSQTTTYLYHQIEEWPGTDKFVIASLFVDTGTSYRGIMQVGTVGGASSLSFGSEAYFTSGLITNYPSFAQLMYDTSITDQFFIVYQVANSSLACQALTVSGTTITGTTPQTIVTTTLVNDNLGAAWDSDLGQALVMYGASPSSPAATGTASLVVVSTSSGSTTVNTPLAFVSGASNQYAGMYWNNVVYDPFRKLFTISYMAENLNNYVTQVTVSGTTPSLSGTHTTSGASLRRATTDGTLDTNSNLVVYIYCNGNDADKVGTFVYTPDGTGTNLSAQAFVGVADSAISASAAGSIIVQGGTVTGVEVDPAVTTGSQVVFDDGGATTRISSAFDPDNNKIVHAFCTTVAHAIVGTVSGTSVTYGTAVQINSNASDYTSTAYDTANDRVVIVYSDNGDSYGYASVGTVSGTSITFGTKVVFSTASSNQKSVVYDANAGKVLIVYRDGGGGDEVKGIVGTVDPSDNSISFGSAATAAATQNFNLAAVYDSNAQKTVVVAQDYTDSTGTAYVATITGTSVSFGTGVDFLAAAVNNNALSVTFNSTDNKVIVGYGKASDNKGYLITGTVSGTSIGFAGETAFSSGTTTNYISLAYKAAGNILGIVYNVSGSSKIRFNNAVISGTSFSFGTEQDLVATTTDTTALILDETADNFVASYGDGSNNYDGTTNVISVSTSAVIGTKYYVTPTGGFSSTAGSPSVNAGLAISTTSLLLNGDS